MPRPLLFCARQQFPLYGQKNDPDLFYKLEVHMDKAIRYAKQLCDLYTNEAMQARNPYTSAHKLVQSLLKLSES